MRYQMAEYSTSFAHAVFIANQDLVDPYIEQYIYIVIYIYHEPLFTVATPIVPSSNPLTDYTTHLYGKLPISEVYRTKLRSIQR